MYEVGRLAELIRIEEPGGVLGITAEQISKIREAWNLSELPSAYVEFLSHMGVRAGRILRGTDAFFPTILRMKEWADEFFDENSGTNSLPDGAIVFGMHQGYLVYWMSDTLTPDPEVVLCAEGDPNPLRTWSSFTAFLNSHYADEPGVK
ncbi:MULTISPECIES: SMI1/KNR4 family protein [unclassified Solwaraspora]|uniref:SMI1/KNR4 family protein n=1 Tax=unclassified Solwaraspora TaxID=2627926 RepID=UPI002499D975|nr:SMI1/KNR4 family protein [Solwaraspora sp. WMMD937]WFE23589.1 SMI1/KNR4 family protein [Solwaraspora sp. WMMD937]